MISASVHGSHTVVPGDTLYAIGQADHGVSWQQVWADNKWIKNPDLIYPGWKIALPARGEHFDPPPVPVHHREVARARHNQTSAFVGSGTLSFRGLEGLWMAAGGPSWAAAHAACIAEHESGGRQFAVGPVGERGYWQINPAAWPSWMATFDPLGNARAAVTISHHGSDWGAWTTAGMCLPRAWALVFHLLSSALRAGRAVVGVRCVRVRVAAMLGLGHWSRPPSPSGHRRSGRREPSRPGRSRS